MSLLKPAGRRICGHASASQKPQALVQMLERRMLLSAAPVIDVMVLYTPQALSKAGGISALGNRINRSVADTNLALSNSNVNASIRLVYVGEVYYTESGVLANDLNNLQAGNGSLAGVASLRDQYGADIVSMWVGGGTGDEAGRAFQPDSFSSRQPNLGFNVIDQHYADDNFVFAHELAHNLGAGHDRSDSTPRAIPYAYGKTFALGQYTVGDIMSDVERIPYFSNPNVSFQGVPTGNPDSSSQPADNARVMNEFAPIVANYRSSTYSDNRSPMAAIDGVDVNTAKQTLTLNVEYADDTAVAVSSLGTGDFVVTGPGGYQQVAAFAGVDFAADGPQRVATYQVNIAGYSADPTAYNFVLQPNRVRDIYGHANPGGMIGAPGGILPNRAGPRLSTAFDAGALDGQSWRFNNWIGADDPTAFYRFTVAGPTQFTAHLSGLSGNVDELLVQDSNGDGQIQPGEVISYPRRDGTSPEAITTSLNAGTYYLWVAPPVLGIGSSYTLTMSAAAAAPTQPPTVPGPPPPPLYGTIQGTVFNDSNDNGSFNSGESGIGGWETYLDLNNNHQLDPGEPTAWTDSSGHYRFTNLRPGAYIVRALPRAGWRQTTPFNNYGSHVTVGAGQIITADDTGETQQARVYGSVFADSNGNGIRDSWEGGLGGWQVYIDLGNVGGWRAWDPTATTDNWGNFDFTNLTPGTYTARVVPQSGWNTTAPAGGALKLTLASGQVYSGASVAEKQL